MRRGLPSSSPAARSATPTSPTKPKESLIAQEVKRVLDAQQSNTEINAAKLAEKIAAADKLPPEAFPKATPLPPTSAQPRTIGGIDQADIQAAVDKANPKSVKDVAKDEIDAVPATADTTGGMQVTKKA